MDRGPVLFALLFLLVPALLLFAAWAVPAIAIGMVILALMLLTLGLTVGVGVYASD